MFSNTSIETADIECTLVEQPKDKDIEAIRRRLQEYNSPFWEVKDKETKLLRLSDGGLLVAGAVITIYGLWLEVNFLWVSEAIRGKGIGTRIVNEIEAIGRKNKCTKICLNTFSFQARPFYEKNGFVVVYERKSYPVTSSQYFMERDLHSEEDQLTKFST